MGLNHRRSRLGFTLVEMVVAVGIVGILAMVAIPMLSGSKRRSELRGVARDTLGKLQGARTDSVSRRQRPGALGRPAGPTPAPDPNQRRFRSASRASRPQSANNNMNSAMNPSTDSVVVETYIRILSTQSYSIVSVTEDDDEQIEQLVDFSLDPSTSAIQIRNPPPDERIEFRNGQRHPDSPSAIELYDGNTGKTVFVDVGLTAMRIR